MDYQNSMKKIKVIISGGGTGGHIFPALSIAESLMKMNPENEILFVGAKGRMEMEKVPAAGFPIIGLNIQGFQRKKMLANITLPFKLLMAIRKSRQIIDDFRPDVVVGVGGYASAALLMAATQKGIPTLIQEQNGFAGKTNQLVGKKADKICVAYEGMERFFPAERIIMTGNPIREGMAPANEEKRTEGMRCYGLDPAKKHLLIIGGSLGCRTLNDAVIAWIKTGCPKGEDVELLWQCGKYYKKEIDEMMQVMSAGNPTLSRIHHTDFIARMDLAYAAADLIISRSGASSISEICACAKASILVPSPNVTEDHQTFNAMALVRKDAALIIKDAEARERLMAVAMSTVHDSALLEKMEANVIKLARPDAAQSIAKEVYQLVEEKQL
ncbi:MAG: undecaprenyldiphospho-muramoylpentapeptide beta-N-acetylglucosaminyltransferase [Bacteroidales bacterium]|nr:undecaprenyldiphospho-muramoylpentapeptide beta-N-acetylglucosaminyltransferase [Bacteroidales bacterium]